MKYPIALCAGQFSDLSLEDICSFASRIGYEGLELSFRSHIINAVRAARDLSYCSSIRSLLEKHHLHVWAVSAHMFGQCVGDYADPRLDRFCPEVYRGKSAEIRKWAQEQMMLVPSAADNLGISVVTGFMGSTLWKYFYPYPPVSSDFFEQCWGEFLALWIPILDEFEHHGITFALEVHPAEMAYDFYSTAELLKRLHGHKAFGINFDPSHLLWQGIDPVVFLREFGPLIRNTHMKDVYIKNDGRSGLLGSHLPMGDCRRAWNFRSPGHGHVPFDDIIRTLHVIGYQGPLTIEWEDNGMDRSFGAKEAFEYIKRLNYDPSETNFENMIANNDKQ